MICPRCKQTVAKGVPTRHLSGVGEVHVSCPPDPQQSLLGEDEMIPFDRDANYPDDH